MANNPHTRQAYMITKDEYNYSLNNGKCFVNTVKQTTQ